MSLLAFVRCPDAGESNPAPISAERGGRQARFDAIQKWRFADGKATSLHYHFADQSVPDGFWV